MTEKEEIENLKQRIRDLEKTIGILEESYICSDDYHGEFEEDENTQSAEDFYEEQREREEEEKAECICGAYQRNNKGDLIQIADCCC